MITLFACHGEIFETRVAVGVLDGDSFAFLNDETRQSFLHCHGNSVYSILVEAYGGFEPQHLIL